MRVLIFGGAGYIGAHVVLEILDAGHEVIIFDNFSTGEISNVDNRATIFKGDILSKKDLKKVFNLCQFDAVMHFCALKAPHESMKYPILYAETNIVGSLNILEMMIKYNVNKFIFSSSSSVYGEPKKKYIDEDHSLSPVSFYGFTKLEIERVLDWYSKITNIKFISLRYFNAAGYDLKSRIKIPENNAQNLIPRIMQVVMGKEKVLKVFGSDYKTKDGTCVRDFIHVNDLATAHLESLYYLKKANSSLSLNIATGKGHTVLEVIKKVKELSLRKVKYKYVKRREGDPSVIISKTKFKDFPLNWKPIYSDLDTIIHSVLKMYKISNDFKNIKSM